MNFCFTNIHELNFYFLKLHRQLKNVRISYVKIGISWRIAVFFLQFKVHQCNFLYMFILLPIIP